METVRVGRKRYSDPDVISLIRATGSLVDPRSAVISQARNLVAKLSQFANAPAEAIERLRILASMKGITIEPMDIDRQQVEKRDAIILSTQSSRVILYNPNRPAGRVAFSIAHEISHAFFPNSFVGARFRTICESSSKEANELERLCDIGASELLMPIHEFRREVAGNFSLSQVEKLCAIFGSSFEATVFRLATAHSGIAAAGLLRYRLRMDEERKAKPSNQGFLFVREHGDVDGAPQPKYRRQSIYFSESCGDHLIVRWNKSFNESSCVYLAGSDTGIHASIEALPNGSGIKGRLEAVRAPYQRQDANQMFGDVLFFWTPDA
jgi:Zn-dependent peptidase ImmA (M78 family)